MLLEMNARNFMRKKEAEKRVVPTEAVAMMYGDEKDKCIVFYLNSNNYIEVSYDDYEDAERDMATIKREWYSNTVILLKNIDCKIFSQFCSG